MKKLLLLVTLLPFFVSAQNETELLKKVRAKLEKVKDYKAEGKIKIDVSFINAPESNVIVYYKNPDKFKVKKSGGISLLPKGGISVNVNSLLMSADHTVVPSGSSKINGKEVRVVKLVPANETSDVVLATLFIDEKDLVVRKYSVTTKENGTYEMELEYGKFTSYGLPDKVVFLFNTKDYKLPKGITFEYNNGEKKKEEDKLKAQKGRVEITYSAYTINKGVDDKVFEEK